MSGHLGWTAFDQELLKSMGIAVIDLPPLADAERRRTIHEPANIIGRMARLKHIDGTETRQFHLTQDEAIEWLRKTRKPDDDILIENAELPRDITPDPYPQS